MRMNDNMNNVTRAHLQNADGNSPAHPYDSQSCHTSNNRPSKYMTERKRFKKYGKVEK